jgi:outer membrane protein OmpA-like peptidoglycan-associated protein
LFTLENNKLLSKVKSDSFTGDYVMVLTEGSEYALYVAKLNYLFESLSFNYAGEVNPDPINIDIYLNPIETGISTRLNNIFFDLDKYEIKKKSTTELNRINTFLEQNPTIGIIIEGHTDNSGESGYNLDLSEKRAKAVYDYLVGNGGESERLSFKGYGQEKPIAANDSETNRQLNRRIEFRIVR